MDPVPTQYIDREDSALAYQVIGEGSVEGACFYECFQHLDLQMTDPDINYNVERIARYSRSVYFQRRGIGLSDHVPYAPTLEQQADDVLAVMDAAGIRRAALTGWFTTCGPLALVAARAPERVSSLTFLEPVAQGLAASDVIHGWTEEERQRAIAGVRLAMEKWGSGGFLDFFDPILDTPFNRRLMATLERSSSTPAAIVAHLEWWMQLDIRDVLPAVQAPTLVIHIPNATIPKAAVQHVAELIPTSTFHVLPQIRAGSSLGQIVLPAIDVVEEFITGTAHEPDSDRSLGTVLFTDVVASTELLERIGDAAYRELRSDHERAVRLAVETAGGRLLTVTGDGTLSVFDSPTRAVRCAETICREAESAGMAVRAGIHTGELEHDAMNVTGLTVHIGARVGAAAEPGQVLVSRTVRDLVAGSGLTFASRGEHRLKGISGSWELFVVTHVRERPRNLPPEESMQTSMDKMVLQTARTAPAFVRAAVRLGNAIERRRARAD